MTERLIRIYASMVAQAAWSASSFFVVFFLIKNLSIENFGVFALFLAFRRGVVMVSSALAIVPVTVLTGDLDCESKNNMAGKLLNTLGLILLLVVPIFYFSSFFVDVPIFEAAVFLLSGIVIDVARRVSYINGNILIDLAGGLTVFICIIFGLLVLNNKNALDIHSAMLLFGSTMILWFFCCLLFTGASKGLLSAGQLIEAWRIGRWGLGSNSATFIYSEINTFYTYALIGPAGVAVLELAKQFIAVLNTLLYGMSNYFQPKLAALKSDNGMRVYYREVVKLTSTQLVFAAFVLTGILSASPYILNAFFPERVSEYNASIPVALVLGLAAFIRIAWQQPSFCLIAQSKPFESFLSIFFGVLFTVPAGYFITMEFGVLGAAWTKVAGDSLIFFGTAFFSFKLISKYRLTEASA